MEVVVETDADAVDVCVAVGEASLETGCKRGGVGGMRQIEAV